MDPSIEPAAFVVVSDTGDRIHFLDWGGEGRPGVVLIHGLSNTAWSWTPVARRVAAQRRVVAMDLRGHGLSDAPTGRYEPELLAADVVAVAEGSGALDSEGVVLAGHGFGGIVAAWAAESLGERCRRLVLVDGGWEDIAASSGMETDEFLRGLDEPPEVLRSMAAYLAERAALRSRDVGRRPGNGSAGDGRRDAGGPPRARDAATRPRRLRGSDVRVSPGDHARRGAGADRRPRGDVAAACCRPAGDGRRQPLRHGPQPDALPAR